jgi:adenine-specific DNA-methyltransferase
MVQRIPSPPEMYGEVFTRRWIVEVLLDLVGYTPDRDLAALRLLEPSCGSGAFLGPAVERLIESATAHGRELSELGDAVAAYDLREGNVEASRALCRSTLVTTGLSLESATQLAERWVNTADFLDPALDVGSVDAVIGNPPYIRYDDLPDGLAAIYRQTWSTMRGRGDIYVGFFERCLSVLNPAGLLAFICADRWMRNQYGAGLRDLIASRYSVEHIWTMHDVDAFDSQVSAYPAITVLGNRRQGSVVVADTTSEFAYEGARALTAASQSDGFEHFSHAGVTAHRLPYWFSGRELWPTGSAARLALIEQLNENFGPLHDPSTGTRVAIGLATGADNAYVVQGSSIIEPDRLLPLAMGKDLTSGTFEWHGQHLVNPWAEDGSLVDLADYPGMAKHFGNHPTLRARFVAKKAPGRWYRTIDKVNADLTARPKLLLQDMKAFIHPVLEHGGHYPHHNLYYVVSDKWDMEVLGGLLLSRIAQAFIEAYCVRMRGGTLRFQAQYLKQIRVPSPDSITAANAAALIDAFRRRDVDAATTAAAEAYGIDPAIYDLTA